MQKYISVASDENEHAVDSVTASGLDGYTADSSPKYEIHSSIVEQKSGSDQESIDDPLINQISDEALTQFNSEIKRIDKIISMWGEAKYLRFDKSHHEVHADLETLPTEQEQPTRRKQTIERTETTLPSEEQHEREKYADNLSTANESAAQDFESRQAAASDVEFKPRADSYFKPNLFAICMTFGGLLAVVLGAAHAITISGPSLTHDIRIAAGFVCAGALGVIFGLWYEVGKLRHTVKHLVQHAASQSK